MTRDELLERDRRLHAQLEKTLQELKQVHLDLLLLYHEEQKGKPQEMVYEPCRVA